MHKQLTFAGAMLDRLTHRVHIIEANGESYRLKDARKRYGKPKKREESDAPGTNPTLDSTHTVESNDQPAYRYYPATRTAFLPAFTAISEKLKSTERFCMIGYVKRMIKGSIPSRSRRWRSFIKNGETNV